MDTKKQLTPIEAWDNFYQNFECEGKTPIELVVAQATRNGRQYNKEGQPKRLGANRIARLLEKYAPGKYELNIFFTTKC